MRRCLAFISALICCCHSFAQKADWQHVNIGAYVRECHMLDGLHIYDKLINSHDYATVGMTAGFKTLPSDNDWFARAYNFPEFGLGLSYSGMSAIHCRPGSHLGDIYSLYGYGRIDLVKTRYFSFGPNLEFGASCATSRWDALNNPMNLYVGTNFLVMIGMGLEAGFHISPQWEIGLNLMVTHRSNGMLRVPNFGLNELGTSLFMKYDFDDRYLGKKGPQVERPELKKWLFDVYFSGGVHSCDPERHWYDDHLAEGEPNRWSQEKPWLRMNLGGTVSYRYHPMTATGLGVDLFYTGNWKRLTEIYESKYGETVSTCPIYLGAYLQQSLYYKNLEIGIGLGVYLFKKLGAEDSTWNYQRALIRYHIPKAGDIFLGFAMRAHSFDRSDTLEFCFGKRF